MFGGVEFGDEPVPAPEQFPFVLAVLWYIMESPFIQMEKRNNQNDRSAHNSKLIIGSKSSVQSKALITCVHSK